MSVGSRSKSSPLIHGCVSLTKLFSSSYLYTTPAVQSIFTVPRHLPSDMMSKRMGEVVGVKLMILSLFIYDQSDESMW